MVDTPFCIFQARIAPKMRHDEPLRQAAGRAKMLERLTLLFVDGFALRDLSKINESALGTIV
jgi:hypothetical protein